MWFVLLGLVGVGRFGGLTNAGELAGLAELVGSSWRSIVAWGRGELRGG